MSDHTAATSQLTPIEADNRMPPHDKTAGGEALGPPETVAARDGAAREGTTECRAYLYEEVSPVAGGGAPTPTPAANAAARTDPHESCVDVVETDGVVREFVVTCSCGRRTRLRVDYGEPL